MSPPPPPPANAVVNRPERIFPLWLACARAARCFCVHSRRQLFAAAAALDACTLFAGPFVHTALPHTHTYARARSASVFPPVAVGVFRSFGPSFSQSSRAAVAVTRTRFVCSVFTDRPTDVVSSAAAAATVVDSFSTHINAAVAVREGIK